MKRSFVCHKIYFPEKLITYIDTTLYRGENVGANPRYIISILYHLSLHYYFKLYVLPSGEIKPQSYCLVNVITYVDTITLRAEENPNIFAILDRVIQNLN